jgi:sensor c-di-GMP phosphodiesterase-like protein
MALARSAVLGALISLAGCAAVPTADGQRLRLGSPAFRDYVERVFREQNRVADAAAFALEAPGSQDADLAAAEQELLAACAGVNELATARRDQRQLGMRQSARAARTVPDCERATRDVDALLVRDAQ